MSLHTPRVIALVTLLCLPSAYGVDLYDAMVANNARQVKEAIAEGQNINQVRAEGRTPLLAASLAGLDIAAKTLLELGADGRIADENGYTAVHGAAFQGRPKVMQVLIDHGLDPNEMHADGFAPIHRACWGHKPRHAKTIEVLLKAGVSPLAPSKSGKTPLDLTRNKESTKLLFDWIKKGLERNKEL